MKIARMMCCVLPMLGLGAVMAGAASAQGYDEGYPSPPAVYNFYGPSTNYFGGPGPASYPAPQPAGYYGPPPYASYDYGSPELPPAEYYEDQRLDPWHGYSPVD